MNYIEKWVFDQSQHTINHVQYQEPVTFIKQIKTSPEFHTLMPLNINFDESKTLIIMKYYNSFLIVILFKF